MWSQRNSELRKSGEGNIFVKNLSQNLSNRDLYELFSPYGSILSCKIVTDMNGRSLGHGFAHFDDAVCAQDAMEKMNGALVDGRNLYVADEWHVVMRVGL